ncbi:MAG TPA: heme-copper oxidase subunit III [Ktedonobacteraceae bacterium]|jgi:heme/copper-type cytochrome/quinol oxidase subunit 3|nr:heme-copper oxidase subunit III [Ktedonobacteraceae bacterium]
MGVVHGEQVRAMEEHGATVGRSLEWWGMVFFIASEALIFANLIAAYLYLDIRSGGFKLPDGGNLSILLPAVNTVLLLASSIPAVLARQGITKGNQKQLAWGLLGTIILGIIFLSGQVYEYGSLYSEGFNVGFKTFGSAFFTLTGFHGLHVTIGVIFLIICLVRTLRGDFTAKKHFAVEAAELYWHFVDGVWIIVFSTVYLLPLLRA